jgi:fructose-bisphosphate aldolase class II
VLHGGSGNSEDDFKQAIANGINIVHINTEIRLAFRDAVKKALQENPDEVAPYKFLKPGMLAVQEVVTAKLKFFNDM